MTYRWNGPMGKGARKKVKAQKQAEAAMRNKKFLERRAEDDIDRVEEE